MDATELGHWTYRVQALTHRVALCHDALTMATAYRSTATPDEVAAHQADLDANRWLLMEARFHVAAAS